MVLPSFFCEEAKKYFNSIDYLFVTCMALHFFRRYSSCVIEVEPTGVRKAVVKINQSLL